MVLACERNNKASNNNNKKFSHEFPKLDYKERNKFKFLDAP